MRHCPHEECGHRIRTGRAAEYLDSVEACAECGTRLEEGPAAGSSTAAASPLGATSRLLVTLAVTLAVAAAQGWQIELDGAALRPFRLGLFPLIAAFIGVEILAAALPRWRSLRHTDRARLAIWSRRLALPLALALALAARPAVGGVWLIAAVVTWVAAVFALAVAADLVTRFGLGNGYAVLIAAAVIPALHELGTAAAHARDGGQLLLALVVLASVVAATRLVLGAHERGGPRLPTCGILPLDVATLLCALPATLQAPGFAGQSFGANVGLVAAGVVTAAAALALGYVFSRGTNATRDELALATVRSVLFVMAAFAAGGLLATIGLPLPSVYLVVVTTAVALDIAREWRVRSDARTWGTVRTFATVTEMEPAVRALRDAGIPILVRNTAVRSLWRFFGPFAPLELRVPTASLESADSTLDALPHFGGDNELQ